MRKNDIYGNVMEAVDSYGMLERQRGVLVGYSGGADSSALLHCMKRLCDERGLYLHALHVNHGIRGDEAERDAAFCRDECARMGIDFTLECADIPGLSEELGCGIEEAARRFRYEAFMHKLGSDERLTCIATAHNADDNTETVIFNMVRGSGLAGMCGIPPIRVSDGVKIIRPLIACPKSDILEYCRENRIEYIFDSTNNDTAYTRNYIRHRVMPLLRHMNPSLCETVSRMTETLREDREYLEGEARRFIAFNFHDGMIALNAFENVSPAVASRAVGELIAMAGGRSPERVHIEAVLSLVHSADEGASVSLPGGICAGIYDGRLYFGQRKEYKATELSGVIVEGVNRFPEERFAILAAKQGRLHTDLQKDNESLQNIYKLSILTQVNSDKIKNRLFVRSRRSGDSYVFGGMTRKLKKLYNDKGFSAKKRAELPIICDDDGIVWVPGFPAADRVKPCGDADCLVLVYYCNGEE